MTTTTMPAEDARPLDDDTGATLTLRLLLAGLSAAAGAIHLAMVGAHAESSLVDGLAFAAAGWAQLGLAVWLFARPSRPALAATLGVNLALLVAWAVSRTTGLPWGAHAGEAEAIGRVDLVTVAAEAGLVAITLALLARPHLAGRVRGPAAGLLTALPLLAVMTLTTAALASGEAAEHGGAGHTHGEGAAGDGHGHGGGGADGEAAFAALAADDVCDGDANVASYYEELAALGPDHHGEGGGGHGHGGDAQDTQLLIELAAEEGIDIPAEVIDDLTSVLGGEPSVVVGHGEHGAGGPYTGLDGHGAPQHWTPLTDPEDCAALEAEMATALEVAEAHPTVQDALDAGYVKATGYIEGIAAHYIHLGHLVNPAFDAALPEMLLYDGDQPDSRMIGLSYAVFDDDVIDPAEYGFTGPNDYPHNHDGLCTTGGGLVVGGESTSDEECARRGGRKIGSALQMIHAWVVPGCESPWGVFSAENPVLDGAVGDTSGQPGSANCAATEWDLDTTPGMPTELASP